MGRRPQSREMLRASYQLALDAGDAQFIVYAVLHTLFLNAAKGTHLEDIRSIADRYQRIVEQTNNDFAKQVPITKRWIAALSEGSMSAHLDGDGFDEGAVTSEIRSTGNLTNLAYVLIYRLQLAYLAGEYELAYELGEDAEKAISGAKPVK